MNIDKDKVPYYRIDWAVRWEYMFGVRPDLKAIKKALQTNARKKVPITQRQGKSIVGTPPEVAKGLTKMREKKIRKEQEERQRRRDAHHKKKKKTS